MTRALLLTLSIGCSGKEEPPPRESDTTQLPGDSGFDGPCDDGGPNWYAAGVASPSDGVEITVSPWIPLMVTLEDDEFAEAEVTTWLDCEEIETHGIIRERKSTIGGGHDFIGYLDLRPLDEGVHNLVHRFVGTDGSTIWRGSHFSIDRPEHEVRVYVNDAAGNPVTARIIVLRDGRPFELSSPDGDEADLKERDSELSSFLVEDGVGTIHLDDGSWRFVATRGPLHTLDSVSFQLAGKGTELSLTVDRAIEREGWSTGDFHMHTGASVDAFIPDHVRLHSVEAVGLDVVMVTDHDMVRDLSQEAEAILGPDRTLRVIPGSEVTIDLEDDGISDTGKVGKTDDNGDTTTDTGSVDTESIGHMCAFPLDPEETELPEYVDDGLEGFFSDLRTELSDHPHQGVSQGIHQLNHPRGIQMRPQIPLLGIHDLFNRMGFDPETAPGEGENAWMGKKTKTGVTAFDFDAMEVMNRASWSSYNLVRADWFGLLSHGRRITATGNSDSHAFNVEFAGYAMNLAPCPPPAKGADADVACWVDAIRGGQIAVTNGPLVNLVLQQDKKLLGQMGQVVAPSGKGQFEALVRVQATDWVPVTEVRVISGGQTIFEYELQAEDRQPDGSLNASWVVPVPLTGADNYVIAEAGWPLDEGYPAGDEQQLGDYALVAPGFLPVGFTNPVFIDEDGDGSWDPSAK